MAAKKKGPATRKGVAKAEVHDDVQRRKAQFLEAFARFCRVDLATKHIGVFYHDPYQWARVDAEFKQQWEEMKKLVAARLKDAAFRRAVTGVLKPVYQRGELVGAVREFSDSLTMFLLKGYEPETFREHLALEGGDRPVAHEHALQVTFVDPATQLAADGGKKKEP